MPPYKHQVGATKSELLLRLMRDVSDVGSSRHSKIHWIVMENPPHFWTAGGDYIYIRIFERATLSASGLLIQQCHKMMGNK